MKHRTRYALSCLAAALMTVCATAPAAGPVDPATKAVAADTTPTADLSADTTYLLPGAFTPNLSFDDLSRAYGASNVTVEELVAIEDQTMQGIVLFANDPLRRAEVFMRDTANLRGVNAVRVRGSQSRWRIDNGFHLGMTLAELVAANGKPLTYYGLAWDYGGMVTDWHGGRLAHEHEGLVHRNINLSPAPTPAAGIDAVPYGEREYRSDDAHYPQQGKLVIVGELMVSFDRPQDK